MQHKEGEGIEMRSEFLASDEWRAVDSTSTVLWMRSDRHERQTQHTCALHLDCARELSNVVAHSALFVTMPPH